MNGNPFDEMQERLDELTASDHPPASSLTPIHDHPKGWEPGITWDPTTGQGQLTTAVSDGLDPIWDELIADWGLDPNLIGLVEGSVQIRAWDANVSEGVGSSKRTWVQRMKYYRATLKSLKRVADKADVNELIAEIKNWKYQPEFNLQSVQYGRSLFVALSDWQVGKGEGDGSAGTITRILKSLDGLTSHVIGLERIGRPVDTIYLCGLGDLVEQCAGHYDMQTFQVDLDRREQMKVVRRLLLRFVDTLVVLGIRLVLVAVPGNHGENRKDGKAFTSWTDNDDLAVFDGVAEVVRAAPITYQNVSVLISEELHTTIDMSGAIVGLSHMHAGRSGSDPRSKVMNWWRGHALGRGRVHDADILVTGHYHHFVCDESCGRTWFQAPAMDPGSAWFTEATGQRSPAGLMVFSVSGEHFRDRKWGDLVIL